MPTSTALVDLTFFETLLIAAALVVGLVVGVVAIRLATGATLRRAREEADALTRAAESAANDRAKDIVLRAEREASTRRTEVDREVTAALASVGESQARSERLQATLEKKLDQLAKGEERIRGLEAIAQERLSAIESERAGVAAARAQASARLESIVGISRDEARAIFLDEVRADSAKDAAALEQRIVAEAEGRAEERSREITLMAIQRYAADVVSESTIKAVRIANDDMKGRIIGREGRNIKTIEKLTGVDILIDDTPGIISVSCFDRVRQAIAAETLQRLLTDGRIHPSRVEEVVEQVRKETNQRIIRAGTEAALEADIRNLHPKLIEAMGKLSYRTSFGQNVLKHSLEVAFLSQMIADQLGLDGTIARRAGFLHDIGKAMDHEIEGGHPAIGMEFAARHGEKAEAVLNAIGGHHADIPTTTPYTPIVMAADALSGARPGARRESMEAYIKRLEQLEAIAREQPSVVEAYAVQAGREVRVIVDAGKIDDATTHMIAAAIAKRVEKEMTFPGEIKVSVLREVRAEATAR
jgi:ribonuclease Y